MKIFIINSGSSTLKFELFEKKGKKIISTVEGIIDGLNLSSCNISLKRDAEIIFEGMFSQKNSSTNLGRHEKMLKTAITLLKKHNIIKNRTDIQRIGHRVVHGGEQYSKPQKINQKLIQEIRKLSRLAPLHNPANLKGILTCQKLFPRIPQYAVFDTAFHQTMPEKAYLYALPRKLYEKHDIRRYGFHGTSHEYVSKKAIQYLKKHKKPYGKIITCHIGNGVSITAVKNGKSIDTSMGFTPLEGVIMGTRCGSIDPAIPLCLQKILKKKPDEIDTILNKASGLLALSGISSDMRLIHKAAMKKNKKAQKAIEIYSYQIVKQIGAYCSALNGLHALVFTAGIGENAWYVRKNICDLLSYLGLKLNTTKNEKNEFEISTLTSAIKILVIPTDEELAIAQRICYNK